MKRDGRVDEKQANHIHQSPASSHKEREKGRGDQNGRGREIARGYDNNQNQETSERKTG